ncbi:hypothetical protein KTR10_01745 [Candidatus Kaiserbacteria bacterium]|nr:hypothetical protein [Candidatus Kaiserbacteria bacterium]
MKPNAFVNRLLTYAYNLRTGDRFVLFVLAGVVFISLIWVILAANKEISTDVPTRGGTFTEGIVGTPRFVNPVLALTSADKDVSQLIYAGLTRLSSDGTIVPDIAASVTISDDGLVYNVILRQDVSFHDNESLTAEDVAFTIEHIQDPLIASPLRASWDGVTLEVLGDYELNFILEEPYAPFIENLTVGILPKHIWGETSAEEFPFSQYNSEPIGAGPYKIKHIIRDGGVPSSYVLIPFNAYHGTPAKISTFVLSFFANEARRVEAFNKGTIDGAAHIDPSLLTPDKDTPFRITTTTLPRTFAVFFNQNKSEVLRDIYVRRALNVALDREALVDRVLDGYGQPLTGPIPYGFGVSVKESTSITSSLDDARDILRTGGWRLNEETGTWEKEEDDEVIELRVSISTANSPLFEETAQIIQETWEQLGVSVEVKRFEQSDLTQAVIRPREYETLLFGTVLGRALDLYSFWHSSQRNDPGLNVALYANITADAALTTARTSTDETGRIAALEEFAAEVTSDVPAIFLFSPQFVYVLPEEVTITPFTGLGESHERFAHIAEWYMDTNFIWTFLK